MGDYCVDYCELTDCTGCDLEYASDEERARKYAALEHDLPYIKQDEITSFLNNIRTEETKNIGYKAAMGTVQKEICQCDGSCLGQRAGYETCWQCEIYGLIAETDEDGQYKLQL